MFKDTGLLKMQLSTAHGKESPEIECYWPDTIILKVRGKQHMA